MFILSGTIHDLFLFFRENLEYIQENWDLVAFFEYDYRKENYFKY